MNHMNHKFESQNVGQEILTLKPKNMESDISLTPRDGVLAAPGMEGFASQDVVFRRRSSTRSIFERSWKTKIQHFEVPRDGIGLSIC